MLPARIATFYMNHLPRPDGGNSANYVKPSMFFSITSQAKEPEAAAMFIDYFTNNVDANEVLFAERGVPISSEIRDALKPELGKAQLEMFEFLDRVVEDSSPIRPPDPVGHADIINNIYSPKRSIRYCMARWIRLKPFRFCVTKHRQFWLRTLNRREGFRIDSP